MATALSAALQLAPRLLLAADCDGPCVYLAAALLSLASESVPVDTELLLDSWIGMIGNVPHLLVRRTEDVE